MLEIEILRVEADNGKRSHVKDFVAKEKPLHVFLNRTFYATIFCSPSNLRELALGHLFSEGLVKSIEEIEDIVVKAGVCRVKLAPHIKVEKKIALSRQFQRVILSACGSKGPFTPSRRFGKIRSEISLKAEVVLDCVRKLNYFAEVFRKTGGVHAAAIFSTGGALVAFAEDVGRHNAVDKAIGIAVLERTNLGECFLALTGRLTGDIVAKAARTNIPVVASIAAAMDSGIAVAKKANLTLIGFVRGKRMNVYTCPERILS